MTTMISCLKPTGSRKQLGWLDKKAVPKSQGRNRDQGGQAGSPESVSRAPSNPARHSKGRIFHHCDTQLPIARSHLLSVRPSLYFRKCGRCRRISLRRPEGLERFLRTQSCYSPPLRHHPLGAHNLSRHSGMDRWPPSFRRTELALQDQVLLRPNPGMQNVQGRSSLHRRSHPPSQPSSKTPSCDPTTADFRANLPSKPLL